MFISKFNFTVLYINYIVRAFSVIIINHIYCITYKILNSKIKKIIGNQRALFSRFKISKFYHYQFLK